MYVFLLIDTSVSASSAREPLCRVDEINNAKTLTDDVPIVTYKAHIMYVGGPSTCDSISTLADTVSTLFTQQLARCKHCIKATGNMQSLYELGSLLLGQSVTEL